MTKKTSKSKQRAKQRDSEDNNFFWFVQIRAITVGQANTWSSAMLYVSAWDVHMMIV